MPIVYHFIGAFMTENTAANQPRRGPGRPYVPGESGNLTGRPRGSRNKATIAAEQLLDGEAEQLARKAIDLALGGDLIALRLCLGLIISPRRDRPVNFDMPELTSIEDAASAISKIASAIGRGELTPTQGTELTNVVGMFLKISDHADIERRLRHLEEREGGGD